jgi:6-phosphogluconate dehydrogenase
MIGGDETAFKTLEPIFATLSPGGRKPEGKGETAATMGYLHCGASGAGHFVKMVHNGVEYGLMAAYAEGLNILKHADAGLRKAEADAETAPLSDPELYQYQLDIGQVAEVWRHGSIISSRLLDLTAEALSKDPKLQQFGGRVSDSGEGRWTVQAAIEVGVPAFVLSAALYSRFDSQGRAEYADKLLSAMRLGFGGHLEKKS